MAMTNPGAKNELRSQIRAALQTISPGVCTAASVQACARLKQQSIWNEAQTILFFAPMPMEPDLWPLLAETLAAGKTVALPRFSSAANAYVACRVRDLQRDIETGRFGIREPTGACEGLPLDRLGLVLVPGVAFDLRGGRLGRGKGFYDRLLAAIPGTKCGVAFDEQIVSEVPVGPRDVRMNCILTPTRWIES